MMDPAAIEGVSISGLVFSLFDERLSCTVDEHGVVRKSFLPGEVFAIPAMAQAEAPRVTDSEKQSQARLQNFEDKLSIVLAQVKAMQHDIISLESKLATSERLVSELNRAGSGPERTRHPNQAASKSAVSASHPASSKGHDNDIQGRHAEPVQRKKSSPRTSPALFPEPVTFFHNPKEIAHNPEPKALEAEGFSLVADIGFTVKDSTTNNSTVNPVFESGGHKKPPSLLAPPGVGHNLSPMGILPPKTPARALHQPQQSSSTELRSVALDMNLSARSGVIPAMNTFPMEAQAVSDLSPEYVTPLKSTFRVGGLQASGGKGPPSPVGSIASSIRSNNKKSFVQYAPPLSARGIQPEKHPELHAKEMSEMKKLLEVHCGDSAELVDRTSIRCLWCKEIILCPPYRPQSFFFKDISTGGIHDGHFWLCQQNPNVTLQAGKGVDVGEGKVLI